MKIIQLFNRQVLMEICSYRIVDVLILLACILIDLTAAIDSITSSQFIKDSESLTSPGSIFKLGFFSPENSTNRYAGIWYNQLSVITPIWVANRNQPLTDSSGILKVSEDGNLVVLNGLDQVLWSSNVSNGVQNSSAQLNDEGNLILFDSNNNSMWESFQQPCNILVKDMRLTADEETGKKTMLTSWKSPFDPSTGSFSAGIDPLGIPQFFVWNDNRPYWRSGPWNGRNFIGIPTMNSVYLYGFTLATDANGVLSLSFTYADQSLLRNVALSHEGELMENILVNGTNSWDSDWKVPATECDVYGFCGVFGVCNAQNTPICSCLKGFEPKNADEWATRNWTAGCVRRTPLQCDRMKNSSEVGKEDGFLRLETMKVPDFAQWSNSDEQQCKEGCLSNCTCVAYSYYPDFGCMSWTVNLIDLQTFSNGGADIFIRLADAELVGNKRKIKTIIGVTVSAGIICILIVAYLLWRCLAKHRGNKKKSKGMLLNERNHTTFTDADNINQVKLQELPLFTLQKLITATDNFHTKNKLGQGGFGPVYKGEFPDGQEIAVKRLSRASGQGFEEFMNEVVVISKLQHRNLVRLFGCCVEGEEKMLVYEYMSNKSLDAFLFDPGRKQLLDWRKRFCIAQGICRGLLYLHRDSRLRIIHRDLKASNILLDQELNPKISDFGMARIFGGNEDQANTKRVVGTYGYMSPEYAMEGRFSEKSDVFSLGVLLLEIVSGRRNTSFYENDEALSLLGFAWKLWIEGNAAALKDRILNDPSNDAEILRCINVGLLCVQEFAKDRPTVSTVISMLNSEIVDLPSPKQPAFSERQIGLDSDSSQNQKKCSANIVTITVVDGR
ncbi:G-type lectin S-receptor-like serine/threonine-protein kinase At1g11330 [Euphorbia lathyris]|uniref:G-type lectin S-receptor-like serine/threonine-protein kinase At1g11330 n=1 Tax=Euphorbia lathyris TaxID=212925 RepID=UPI0033144916